LKCVYLAIMNLDPTGTGRRRWAIRWRPANAFEITFDAGTLKCSPVQVGWFVGLVVARDHWMVMGWSG
jgi:hypothetical protein